MYTSHIKRRGFTLIELSIVLVVIGLIVGGVLVGQSLISAAAARSQVSQIEKFQTATNTFYGKYGYLPGDIPAAPAALFGFAARGPYSGEGDGNGFIEGNSRNQANAQSGADQAAGETLMFWQDLSNAGLIEGTFNSASSTVQVTNITGTNLGSYYPQAKVGQGNYVLVMGGCCGEYMNFTPSTGPNFFLIEAVTTLGVTIGAHGTVLANPGLTVQQAYSIDSKIDDGMPTSGRVLSVMLSQQAYWMDFGGPPTYPAQSPNKAWCYDNGGVAGVPVSYSVNSYPNNMNCTLSFQFQ